MLFEIKNVTIVDVQDVASGTSKSGNAWTKATVIVEQNEGNYKNTYAMLAFGERIQEAENLVGKAADVKFSIQGREYGERWYTDLRLQFVKAVTEEKHEPAPEPAPAPAKESKDADLPF